MSEESASPSSSPAATENGEAKSSAPQRKRSGCWGVFIGVLLILSLAGNIALIFLLAGSKLEEFGDTSRPTGLVETVVQKGKGTAGLQERIAIIELDDVIFSDSTGPLGGDFVSDYVKLINYAATSNKVKAIILAVNSPGGEITASDIIYNAVKEADAKKPVVVHMGSLAASGGYYISCGGRHIVATETTLTGSIGVIIQTPNISQLLNNIGVDVNTFTSGDFKDTLSAVRDMREEEREYVQELVMESYDRFCEIVASARPQFASADELKNSIVADGRIFTGVQAKDNGLVDEIGYIDTAIQKARDLGKAPNATVVKYSGSTFAQLFGAYAKTPVSQDIKVDLDPDNNFVSLKRGMIYLLPPIMVAE